MAKGYVYDEMIGFFVEYMYEFRHVRSWIWDPDEEEGVCDEVLEGAVTQFRLDPIVRELARQYVLTNVPCLAPWVRCIHMTY